MNPKIYTVLLLLLGLALPVLSDKCPDRDRLPTTCKCIDEFGDGEIDVWLLCSGSTIRELKDALRLMNKRNRHHVTLNRMKLRDLPSRIFYGLNVVNLGISQCELEGLSPPGETALEGLEETLEVLGIFSSFTEDERPFALHSLAHLSRLRELDLSYNAITEVHNHWFSSPPPALSHLTFSNNGIEKLGDRAFEKLVNLEYLGLYGNRFGPIKRSMFPTPANRLEHLDLENNAFTSVPDDLFTNMPELKELSIRTNGIVHLQERAFEPIWPQLNHFNAINNPLECDSTMEWLFHVRTQASVSGICKGPFGREGMDLHDFIKNRGQWDNDLTFY